MKGGLVTPLCAALLVLCTYCAGAVDGAATARDVRILESKIKTLKKLINQTNTNIKLANDMYQVFLNNAAKIEVSQDATYTQTQKHCNGRIGLTKRFINNQTSLLGKMLTDRVDRVYKTVDGRFKQSMGTHNSFKKVRSGTISTGRDVTKKNNELNEGVDKKIKTIELGMQTQNVGEVEESLFLANRQIQLQQFSEFEKTRSDGYSGIKQIKSNGVGGKNYYSADHKDWSVAGITDHPEQKDVLGIGEFSACLNGIDFRSAQRTYRMEQPSYNGVYDDTKSVTIPDVPPEIQQMTSVDQQIVEMRKWFQDFQNSDTTERNVNAHFKPFLSYIEGAFTNDVQDDEELETNQYLMDTASSQSVGYGPSTIMGFDDNKHPEYSTWKSRIVVHPISRQDLSPKKFRMNPDIVSQIRYYNSYHNLRDSPAADFDLQHLNGNGFEHNKPLYYTYLDTIMEEVVGKENSDVNLKAEGLDGEGIISANPNLDDPVSGFNAARYHRAYKLQKTDAMGISNGQRSFSDRLFVAITNQPKVSGPKLKVEETVKHVRSSYGIPLEIIYLTPLSKWNPYEVSYKEDCNDLAGKGTKDNPYDSACPQLYYFTPQAFFKEDVECGKLPGEDAAFFKAADGQAVCLVASGVRTVLPLIQGHHDRVRQRYPIVPVFKDGNSAAKKLNAIEDGLSLSTDNLISKVSISTGASCRDGVPKHKHHIRLSVQQFQELEKNKILKNIRTLEDDNGHQHVFTLTKESDGTFKATECDSENPDPNLEKVCWDQHNPLFQVIAEPLKPGSKGYGYGYGPGYRYGY